MDLLERCPEFVKGALRVWRQGDVWCVSRFTDAQQRTLDACDYKQIRSYASSGIRLELDTDASRLDADFLVSEGSAQELYGFDLLVDGVLHAHWEGSIQEATVSLQAALPQGRKRLTLLLPCMAQARIRGLRLENATVALPASATRTLLCLGDSITQGYISHYPSITIPWLLARGSRMDLLNQGIGADTFCAEEVDSSVSADEVVISFGTNDWSSRTEVEFQAHASAYLAAARRAWPEQRITVLTPFWRWDADDMPQGWALDRVGMYLRTFANEKLLVLDGYRLLPRLRAFYAEHVHPNELGAMAVALQVAEAWQ